MVSGRLAPALEQRFRLLTDWMTARDVSADELRTWQVERFLAAVGAPDWVARALLKIAVDHVDHDANPHDSWHPGAGALSVTEALARLPRVGVPAIRGGRDGALLALRGAGLTVRQIATLTPAGLDVVDWICAGQRIEHQPAPVSCSRCWVHRWLTLRPLAGWREGALGVVQREWAHDHLCEQPLDDSWRTEPGDNDEHRVRTALFLGLDRWGAAGTAAMSTRAIRHVTSAHGRLDPTLPYSEPTNTDWLTRPQREIPWRRSVEGRADGDALDALFGELEARLAGIVSVIDEG